MSFTDRVRCVAPENWANDFSQCLYEWQGLEGGFLALVAAAVSIFFLRRQIMLSDKHEGQRLQRQQNAARATLPLTLSGLIESLRSMLLALELARIEVKAKGQADDFEPPHTPTEHIAELQAVIATTDKDSVIKPMSQIIREIQTLWSRVGDLRDQAAQRRRVGLEQNIDEWIVQAAQIHALIESLFDYARAETEDGPSSVSWERAESVIFQLGIESTSLKNAIQRKLEKSPNFWTLNGYNTDAVLKKAAK